MFLRKKSGDKKHVKLPECKDQSTYKIFDGKKTKKLICITICLLSNFHAFLTSADFFSKSIFSKNSFRNIIRVSNSLDPDQAQLYVGPDLGPNCLQRLSVDDTRR